MEVSVTFTSEDGATSPEDAVAVTLASEVGTVRREDDVAVFSKVGPGRTRDGIQALNTQKTIRKLFRAAFRTHLFIFL